MVHVSYKLILVYASHFAFIRGYSLSRVIITLKCGHSVEMDKMQILSALRMIKHIPYLCQLAVCNYSLLHQRCKNHGMTKMLKNRTMYEK